MKTTRFKTCAYEEFKCAAKSLRFWQSAPVQWWTRRLAVSQKIPPINRTTFLFAAHSDSIRLSGLALRLLNLCWCIFVPLTYLIHLNAPQAYPFLWNRFWWLLTGMLFLNGLYFFNIFIFWVRPASTSHLFDLQEYFNEHPHAQSLLNSYVHPHQLLSARLVSLVFWLEKKEKAAQVKDDKLILLERAGFLFHPSNRWGLYWQMYKGQVWLRSRLFYDTPSSFSESGFQLPSKEFPCSAHLEEKLAKRLSHKHWYRAPWFKWACLLNFHLPQPSRFFFTQKVYGGVPQGVMLAFMFLVIPRVFFSPWWALGYGVGLTVYILFLWTLDSRPLLESEYKVVKHILKAHVPFEEALNHHLESHTLQVRHLAWLLWAHQKVQRSFEKESRSQFSGFEKWRFKMKNNVKNWLTSNGKKENQPSQHSILDVRNETLYKKNPFYHHQQSQWEKKLLNQSLPSVVEKSGKKRL